MVLDKTERNSTLALAFIEIGGALFILFSPLSLLLKLFCLPVFALGVLRFFQGILHIQSEKRLKGMKTYNLLPSKLPQHEGEMYGAEAFQWDNFHTQAMYDLASQDLQKYSAKNKELGGLSIIHGVRRWREETHLFLPDSVFPGHLGIIGSTRVGKTKWLEIPLAQIIARGDPLIIIEPKGDNRLLNFCYSQAVACGREEDFLFFALPYPQHSATYNPLGEYRSVTDIADRFSSLFSQDERSKPFRDYCHKVVLKVLTGLDTLGKRPTLVDVQKYAFVHDYTGELTCAVILHFFKQYNLSFTGLKDVTQIEGEQSKYAKPLTEDEKKCKRIIGYYKQIRIKENKSDPACEGLIQIYETPQDYFAKMTGELDSLLSKLNEGEKKRILSSMPCDIDWPRAIKNKKIVYFYLGSMVGAETAGAVGKMAIQDLIAYVGRRYIDSDNLSPVWLIIDEFQNVCYDGFVDLISKAGGAGLRIILAMQSLADIKAKMGQNAAAAAEQVLANLNTKIFMRVPDEESALGFTGRQGGPKTIIKEYSEMSSVTPEADDPTETFDSSYRKTRRDKEVPLVRPEWISSLPTGEAFIWLQAKIRKAKFPLFPKPKRNFLKEKGIK